jgi:hypothetical protein
MDSKEQILKAAGFVYHFDRMAYVNREKRKVFAVETVEDHSPDWLVKRIEEPNTAGDWKFYDEPSIAVRRALVAELEDAQHTHR